MKKSRLGAADRGPQQKTGEKCGLELWLVRHGETTRTVGRRIAGWADPSLTAKGRCEAEALRPLIEEQEFTSVWSSDLKRAVTTAELAWGTPQIDARLREFHFGDLEGKSFDEIDKDMGAAILEFRDFSIPGGETSREFSQRIKEFINDLPAGRHLLFTHGGVVRLLVQDLGLDRFLATGSLVSVDWRRQKLIHVHEVGTGSFGGHDGIRE